MRILSASLLALAAVFATAPTENASAQAFPTCDQRGEGAALLEGECVSISGSYQRQNFNRATNTIAKDADQFSLAIQGQKAVGDNLYVSLFAGYSRLDSPRSLFGLEREADRFSLGATIKYVKKDLLLGAALSVGLDDIDQTTAAAFANTPGRGVVFTNEEKNYNATLTVRAATLFDDGNGYYAKPSLDVGLIYTHVNSSNTAFRAPLLGRIETSDHVFAFVRPALEVGLDLEYETYAFRPFVFGGAQFLFNEDETRKIDGAFIGIALNDDELRFERNSASAFLGAGATIFASGGVSSRVTYAASFQSRQVAHNVSARLQLDF